MQSYRGRQQMLLLCLAGFLAGIFYANFIAKNYVTMTGIFHEYFLNQYTASGIIARDYLIYLRIEYAKELLGQENISVADLCRKVGYGNVSHFIKLFREVTGVTPAKYRKKVKGKDEGGQE